MCLVEELEHVGADAAYVGIPDPSTLAIEVARVTPWSDRPVRLAFPTDAPYPLAETLRTGRPLFIASNEQLACDHPGLTRVVAEDHACATLPLLDRDGSILGAVNFGFEEPHPFRDDEIERIRGAAERCATTLAAALERA